MKRVITEIKEKPVLYILVFFPVMAAFFAGGRSGLGLSAMQKDQVIEFFYHGDTFWQIVGSVFIKRLVLLLIQAFFCIWIVGLPISITGGLCFQISWSLPWFCMIRNAWHGFFVVVLTLPLSVFNILSGGMVFAVIAEYFMELCREITVRKSGIDILREGWIPMRKILACGVVCWMSILPEVLIFTYIAR